MNFPEKNTTKAHYMFLNSFCTPSARFINAFTVMDALVLLNNANIKNLRNYSVWKEKPITVTHRPHARNYSYQGQEACELEKHVCVRERKMLQRKNCVPRWAPMTRSKSRTPCSSCLGDKRLTPLRLNTHREKGSNILISKNLSVKPTFLLLPPPPPLCTPPLNTQYCADNGAGWHSDSSARWW